MTGAAVDGVDEAAPKPANGDGEDAAPPPKTLLFGLIAANGDEVEDASLAKPEASKADAEVCGWSLPTGSALRVTEVVW